MLVLAASIISVARVLKRGVKHLMSFLSLESAERGEIKPLPKKWKSVQPILQRHALYTL